MTVKKFFEKFLKSTAHITVCNEAGSIMYTGPLKDVWKMRWLWEYREVVTVDGIGDENDLFITVTERIF
jgi:hypothetical protein